MPTRFTRRTALAVGALAVSGALLAFTPLTAGYRYTFRVASRTTDAKGKTKDDQPMVAKVQVAGDRARMDFVETRQAEDGNGMVKDGGWMIADRAKRTLTMVDPEEKTYTTMPVESFGGGMGAMIGGLGKAFKVRITNPRFGTQDLGSGGVVQGLSTRHYKVTHDYEMDMQVLWKKEHDVVHTEAEYWVNDEVKSHANPFFEILGSVGTGFMSSDTTFVKQVQEATKKLFTGVPVKSVSTTTMTNQKGEKTVTVSTIEMLDFVRGDVPSSIFAVPAGYTEHTITEADVAKAKAEQQRQADSAKAASAKEASDEASSDDDAAAKADSAKNAKDAAKDAAKKKLKGLFGRP